MPTRKPKRTNWRERALHFQQQAVNASKDAERLAGQLRILQGRLQWLESNLCAKHLDLQTCSSGPCYVCLLHQEENCAAQLESNIKFLNDRLEKESDRALAAERHNAELLKEREALRRDNGDLFLRLERFRTGLDKPEKEYCLCGETAPNCKCEQKFGKSWLRRNWVELTVMATVLGAIAFVVWRAWRGV